MDSGLSLLTLGMPGVLTLAHLHADINLDTMKISLDSRSRGAVHEMRNLVQWSEGDATDSGSLKGIIAEFAAAVGPEISREVVCDFGR